MYYLLVTCNLKDCNPKIQKPDIHKKGSQICHVLSTSFSKKIFLTFIKNNVWGMIYLAQFYNGTLQKMMKSKVKDQIHFDVYLKSIFLLAGRMRGAIVGKLSCIK